MSTIKMFVGLFAIVAVAVLGLRVLPPIYANYQFQDSIETEARLSTYTTRNEEDIKADIYKKAQELEIPVTKDQIKVSRGMGGSGQGVGGVIVTADYSVHIDLPGYPFDLQFHSGIKNKSIY